MFIFCLLLFAVVAVLTLFPLKAFLPLKAFHLLKKL